MRTLIQLFEQKQNKFYPTGSCVNSFDENGYCINSDLPWNDVNDFAVVDEEMQEISKEEFEKIAVIPQDLQRTLGNHKLLYFKTDNPNLIILYDDTDDVHWFFVN